MINARDHPISSALPVVPAHILTILGFVANDPKGVRWVYPKEFGLLGYISGNRRGRFLPRI